MFNVIVNLFALFVRVTLIYADLAYQRNKKCILFKVHEKDYGKLNSTKVGRDSGERNHAGSFLWHRLDQIGTLLFGPNTQTRRESCSAD